MSLKSNQSKALIIPPILLKTQTIIVLTQKRYPKINKSICNINYTDTNARIEKYVNKPDESQFIPIFYISLNNECTFGDEYYYKIYIPNNAKANDVEK